jgi:hypothetical protein
MAASAKPMIAVLVCSVTPTYGAISRRPTISSTSTAPEQRNVTVAATHAGSGSPVAGRFLNLSVAVATLRRGRAGRPER